MRIQENTDGPKERLILSGMITNRDVLAKIASKWQEGGLFRSKLCNTLAGLAVKYHNKYNKPPKRLIENLFVTWAERHAHDDATISMGESLLAEISSEYARGSRLNTDFLIDLAAEYFNTVRLEKLATGIQTKLAQGDVNGADVLLAENHKVIMGTGEGIDLFQDREQVKSTFDPNRLQPLITYPGALGEFFGDSLARGNFIAFMAPDKTGKTWWLVDLAWNAMLQRRKVAFFEVGDQTKDQIAMRFYVRAARHPYRSTNGWPYTINYPTSIVSRRNEDHALVTSRPLTFTDPLNEIQAWKACERVMRKHVRSQDSYFRMSVHPNSTLSVEGIKTTLRDWTSDGYVPDVIIVDYADILAPPAGRLEYRDQINTTWKQLRSLSEEFHVLVVTATQSNAAAYGRRVIDRSNFSEDKRKNAHVTGMVGINVTAAEYRHGIYRLNWPLARELSHGPYRCCCVVHCLPLGNPAVLSCWENSSSPTGENSEKDDDGD